ALAQALALGLGAVPILVTEAEYVDNVTATCLASGLGIRTPEAAARVPRTCAVLPFPADATAESVAAQYMERFRPKALVAIEKLGPNEKGVAHSSTGRPSGNTRSRAECLFDLAAQSGILTIGIGDNGNEIGCGTIREAVWEHKEWGKVCQCPCQGGLATRVATDVVLVAGTSNWGAYGIEAALAAVLGKPELIHSEEDERRMLEACVRTGGADGSTGSHILAVDGTPSSVQTGMNALMRTIVVNGLKPPRKRPF
ncbi:MAG: glutamate cyclase domain-containing protein, partial [Chloroflexota bacterium]